MENKNQVVDEKKYPAHWLENIINLIEERNVQEIALSTGKTPSGHIHLGIMRELLICDAIKRVLKEKNKKAIFRLFFDSLDAAKRFPSYISEKYATENLGKPFAFIPNPINDKKTSYAQFFGDELSSTFPDFGIEAEIVWTHDLYNTDEMKEMIRIGLIKNELVKSIVARFLTATMNDEQKLQYLEQQKSWMGAMVICEKCHCTQKKKKDGTISPNRVFEYNKKTDECSYKCPACGYLGKVKISSGLIKLNWRLDWPAKWTIYKTTVEPAGKDHCTPGGSYDTGLELCKEIYDYKGPIKVSYEWLRLGNRDMKTSKGIVFTPHKFLKLADPRILRMLIYQTNPNKHLSIRIEELENYYNDYQRIERIYYNIEEATNHQEKKEINFIYPLIQINGIPDEFPIQIPFKLFTVLAQLKPILKEEGIYKKTIEYLKKEGISKNLSLESLMNQVEKASNWINEISYLIDNEKDPMEIKKLKRKVETFSFLDIVTKEIKESIDNSQKGILSEFLKISQDKKSLTESNIKEMMMGIREKLDVKPMKIFQIFYLIFFGTKKGPRLGPIMAMLEKKWIENRIKSVLIS